MGRGPAKTYDVTRIAIADAACTLVGREGLAALSIRRVAAESGVSPGRVQHYFPGRAELVHAAFDHVQQRTQQRIEGAMTELTTGPEIVVAILRAMIPRTPSELEEARVVASFEALSLTEPVLGDALREGHAALTGLLAALLAGADTEINGDPGLTATGLLSVAEGVFGQVLHSQLSVEHADRILNEAIGRVIA